MDIIKQYYENGFTLIPLRNNTKIPVEKGWTEKPALSYDELMRHKNVNYGISARQNGLVIIDIDTHDENDPNLGFKSVNALQEFSGQKLPDTFIVETPSGGQHWYYKLPDEYKERSFDKSLKRYPQVDFIVNDKQLVVPPSTIDGNEYYIVKGSLDNIPEAPDWLLRMYVTISKKSEVPTEPNAKGKLLMKLVEVTAEGGRNEHLARVCGSLFRTGIPADKVLFFLKLTNQIACRPPLDESEVKTIFKSIKRSEFGNRSTLKSEDKK